MAEGHTLAQRQQPVGFRVDRGDRDAEPTRRAPEQERIADWLGRRKQ